MNEIKINTLIDLNLENYIELTKYIDNHEYEDKFTSPIALFGWTYYGYKFKFKICEINQVILIYIKHKNKQWSLCSSFYNLKNFNLNKIYRLVENDLSKLNDDSNIVYDNITEQMINDWQIDPNKLIQLNYYSNYIYLTETFKTFAGRKLQKKRNHLNNFVKQNYNYELINLNDFKDKQILLEYIENHNKRYQNSDNFSEMQFYKDLILKEIDKTKNYIGLVILINKKIVGVTICYLRKDICEIVLEKAEHEITGLYQFLIQQNLIVNNINKKYIDRQDDAFIEGLRKSKLSYYPIITISRFSSKV